jgi:DNA 3'-phosphatase
MDWFSSNSGTCFYTNGIIHNQVSKKRPVVGFDFDDTLVDLKTRAILPNVIEKLKALYETYDIVIFSNQLGVKRGKVTNEEVQNVFETFINVFEFPINVFYSIDEDIYRKPNTGMVDLYTDLSNGFVNWFYYCGDAAGRYNDFSTSDLFFANNCSIRFKVPEQIFGQYNGQFLACKEIKALELYKEDDWKDGGLSNHRKIFDILQVKDNEDFDVEFSKDKMIIVMVGAPGSGKSSLTKHLSDKYLMGIINGDTIGSKSKQVKKFNEYVELVQNEELYGIIIDNTNPSKVDRDFWFDKLDETWDKEVIYIDISKPLSFHLTNYRTNFGHKKIPSVVIHTFYKKLEIPNRCIHYTNPLTNIDFNHNLRFVWR